MRVYDGKAKREGEVLKDQTDPTTGRWLLIRWDGHYGEPQWVDAGLVKEITSPSDQADLEGPAFTHRRELLNEAIAIITKDRNNSYGDPDQDFTRIAELWNTYLQNKEVISGHDVAVMMILLKVSRLSWNPSHKDSWLDVAGYAACGYETEILRRLGDS